VLDLLSFDLYLGKEECVGSELLNGVENISDSLDGHLGDLIHPVVNDFKNLFVLVCLHNIADDIVLVRCVYLDEAGCLRLSLNFLCCFIAYLIAQLYLPGRTWFPVGSVEYSGKCDLANNEEVLVHLVHQVFQVGVDRCLRINSGLLVGKQVIELDNANRDDFLFLRSTNSFFQNRVLDYLVCQHSYEMV